MANKKKLFNQSSQEYNPNVKKIGNLSRVNKIKKLIERLERQSLITGTVVLVLSLHTVDEIHNCNNPEFDKDKEYDNFVCNWEKDDFEYLYIDNVGLVHELKKEFRDRRTEGLRSAIEQRKEAEKLVRDEMKALGYDNSIPYGSNIRWYNF